MESDELRNLLKKMQQEIDDARTENWLDPIDSALQGVQRALFEAVLVIPRRK